MLVWLNFSSLTGVERHSSVPTMSRPSYRYERGTTTARIECSTAIITLSGSLLPSASSTTWWRLSESVSQRPLWARSMNPRRHAARRELQTTDHASHARPKQHLRDCVRGAQHPREHPDVGTYGDYGERLQLSECGTGEALHPLAACCGTTGVTTQHTHGSTTLLTGHIRKHDASPPVPQP